VCFAGALNAGAAAGATIDWKGHTWQVTSGGMAGVCEGSAANVTVDSSGNLHLRLAKSGSTWTASEIFTTDKLGFGTYQWQVDGPVDTYDKNIVLGLFPYGPAAGIGGDGTNEIDIEYSRWGQANGPNGDFTDYPASGNTVGERSFTFSLGGSTLSTSRFVWTTTKIVSSLFSGLVPVTSNDGALEQWAYAPANPSTNIPQQALPLGMNLWCSDAPPSDGQPVEIVIRDFTFVPEGTEPGGAGGSDGAGGAGVEGGASGTTAGGAPGAGATAGKPAGAAGAGSAGIPATGGKSAGVGGAPNAGAPATAGAAGNDASGGRGDSGRGGATANSGSGGTEAGARATGSSGARGTASNAANHDRGCACSLHGSDDGAAPVFVALTLAIATCRRRRERRQPHGA
jgi:hypothetical protein